MANRTATNEEVARHQVLLARCKGAEAAMAAAAKQKEALDDVIARESYLLSKYDEELAAYHLSIGGAVTHNDKDEEWTVNP